MQRFIEAQENTWETAYAEIKWGKKETHWMWFIFPQIKGLGRSDMAKYYAIKDKREAVRYLNHPILGFRLQEITEAMLNLPTNDAEKVLGCVDSIKLKSSMTLFAMAANEKNSVFVKVLDKYYDGEPCRETLRLLGIKIIRKGTK